MKPILAFSLLLLGLTSCNADQQPKSLNDIQVKHIASFCKVWEFLKYYHPAVADGNIDWDSAFIQFYPKIKNANSAGEFNKVLLELYAGAEHVRNDSGHFSIFADSKEEICIIDFDWLDDNSIYNNEVIKALHRIKDKFKPEQNHYVSSMMGGDNPDFSADNKFNEIENPYPEEVIRALALSRFWNIINYFYLYKSSIGTPWDSVLVRYLPGIISAKDTAAYQFTSLHLYKSINDGHSFTKSSWVSKYYGTAYIPLMLSDIEEQPVITNGLDFSTNNLDSVLSVIGVHKGDVLLKINGRDVDSLRKSYLKCVPGSNAPGKMRNATSYVLRGKQNEKAILTVSDGKTIHNLLTMYDTQPTYSPWSALNRSGVWKILDGNIGYVDMGNLNPGQVGQMMKDFTNTKAIVLDVRNYPHGSMYEIGKFLGKKKFFVWFSTPDVLKPGYISKSDKVMAECGDSEIYHGKIAILANEQTQSHAEFTVMSLQSVPGAKTFGSQTAGADGNISTIYLPGGVNTIFTGLGVFYPDGTPTQRVGIKIDYLVKPTIKGIREGRDEVLERAIRYINTGS